MKRKLTVSDGLNFGCGFWVAGFVFFIFAVPVSFFTLITIALIFNSAFGLAGY